MKEKLGRLVLQPPLAIPQVKQEKLGDAEVQSLVEGIFREVQVQSHTVSDRRTVYSFLKFCLCNRVMGKCESLSIIIIVIIYLYLYIRLKLLL